MLKVWNFTNGSHQGIDLRGLQVAMLQVSDENLASPSILPTHSVIYLPDAATPEQAQAITNWLQLNQKELVSKDLAVRTVPMHFARLNLNVSFSAGEFVRLQTAELKPCGTGGCGEQLWYTPRTPTNVYTVILNRESIIQEPALALKWVSHLKRSVFLARFGDHSSGSDIFVNSTQFCHGTGNPF